MDEFRAFLALARAALRTQVERPVMFWGSLLGAAAFPVVEAAGTYLVMRAAGTLGGWNTAQVLTLYAIATLGIGLYLTFGYSIISINFANLLTNGYFDRGLTLPVRPLTWLLGSELQVRELGRTIVGIALLAWAGSAAGIRWGAAAIGLITLAVLCTALILLAVNLAVTALIFRTRQNSEVGIMFGFGSAYLAGYPLQIFESALRLIFIYLVPIGATVYVPTLWLLHKEGPAWAGRSLLPAVPALTLLALAAGYAGWRNGLRRHLEAS